MIRFTGPDGWEQTVWRVPGAVTEVLSDELSQAVHYIADGHHRVAASLRVWQLAGRPSGAGVMCVIYPLDGPASVGLPSQGHRPGSRLRPARARCPTPSTSATSLDPDEATGCFGLYVDGRWYDATYNGVRPAGAAGLDIAILNDQVLEPLLGSGGHAASRLEIVPALSSLDGARKACDQDGGAFFALRPPTLDQLTDVADRGEVMPPKTTYFDPKPYAGIFLR